jgi:MYXO-CTERM domain-containing protein
MGAFVPGSITVEDGSGQPVDVTVHEGPAPGCPVTWAEIIPKQPWSNGTTYIVRVKPMYPTAGVGKDNLRFVAGAASLPDPELAAPKSHVSMLTGFPPDGAACVAFTTKTCVNVEGQTEDKRDIEVIVRRGDKMLMRSLMWANDSDFGFAEEPDCLELRRRAKTGKRSPPVILCGKDLPSKKLANPSGNWSTWPVCKDGAFEEQSSATSQGNPDLPKPDTSAAGMGDSQPPAAGGDDPQADDDSPNDDGSHADDDSRAGDNRSSDHREYGCSAASTRAGTRAPLAMLAAIAAGAVVRRRRAAKRR